MALTQEDKDWITTQLSERLERLETKLLAAFHDWSEPVTTRMRSHAAEIRALQVDPESLEDRVNKLEGNR